ncbi:TlpA family protein disulfide reductase [Natrarchaeobius chitinivorans]|uniref:TlpA family protein disulfide reductase n=1 Tax=Natrarchaeobius chitinivorans TaxID=1679083 RepID=A0A3N6LZM6_NATCH|nr:TlpA disulfide reductase family protein [Natrarchaeobius chitinivorans]RQG93404.1 TlpA family protein disulfide reductase [Natrarchaeobius chitinivorans]
MRRRDLVAGVASVGVLAGAGAIVLGGLPTGGTDGDGATDDDAAADGDAAADDEADSSTEPLEIRTIDAQGSEAGTVSVPNDGVTVVMFFVTGCGNCQAQMPRLAEARSQLVDEYGDELTVVSVTYQTPETMPEDELRAWWADLGGDWYVGYDSSPSLATRYGVVGYPVTVVIDEAGEKRWDELGVIDARDIVGAVESVFGVETGL